MAMKHAVTIMKVDRHGNESVVKFLTGNDANELKKRATDLAEQMTYANSGNYDEYVVSKPVICED